MAPFLGDIRHSLVFGGVVFFVFGGQKNMGRETIGMQTQLNK